MIQSNLLGTLQSHSIHPTLFHLCADKYLSAKINNLHFKMLSFTCNMLTFLFKERHHIQYHFSGGGVNPLAICIDIDCLFCKCCNVQSGTGGN